MTKMTKIKSNGFPIRSGITRWRETRIARTAQIMLSKIKNILTLDRKVIKFEKI
jgi:hypothetical protein